MDLAELRDRCQQSLDQWRRNLGHTETENCQAPISVVEALELIDELKKLRELCGEMEQVLDQIANSDVVSEHEGLIYALESILPHPWAEQRIRRILETDPSPAVQAVAREALEDE